MGIVFGIGTAAAIVVAIKMSYRWLYKQRDFESVENAVIVTANPTPEPSEHGDSADSVVSVQLDETVV